jgi:hypothetical protein
MIQYFHDQSSQQKKTVAVVVPPKRALMALLADPGAAFMIDVGVAYCSKKDQYNKRRGRDLSRERMQPALVMLDSVVVDNENPDILYIQLRNKTSDAPAFFAFRVNLKATKAHYIGS